MADAVMHLEFARRSNLRRVIRAEEAFLGVATAVSEGVTAVREAFDWRLTEAHTRPESIWLQLVPEPKAASLADDAPLRVVNAVVDGVASLAESDTRPQFFDDAALEHVVELVGLANDLGDALHIRNGTRGTHITSLVGEHLSAILLPEYDEIGSLEGTLEGVHLHGDRYFTVYDFLTHKGVKCRFGQRITLAQISAALARRVAIYGTIHVRRDGQPESMSADSIDVFPSEENLPTVESVRGIIGG